MTSHDAAHGTGHADGAHAPINQKVAEDIKGLNFGQLLKNWAPFFIGLIAATIFGWVIWTPVFYAKNIQPVDFNHKIHTDDAGMDCTDCHSFNEAGRFSGVPKSEMCLDCHTWSGRQNDDNTKETAFLEKYVNEDDELIKPVQWYIYSKQPDCVYFSHIAHVEMGQFECTECHGNHGESTNLRPYYENRLTQYSKDVYTNMKMTDCADCHSKHKVPQNNGCFVCHK